MRHPFRNIFLAGLIFLASGVMLRVSDGASEHDRHRLEAESVIKAHVQSGVTGASEVIERFGEPAARLPRRGPGQSEVLAYHHQSLLQSTLPRLPVFSTLERSQPADTFFEISDGVVTRYWTQM